MTIGKGKSVMTIVLFAALAIVSCGGAPPSPIEAMKAPIRVVRNDTITQVESADGRLYVLSTIERVDYYTAFLDLGEELVLKGSQ